MVPESLDQNFDVLIIGAGLSGICGIPSPDAVPGEDVRDPRGAQRDRRNLGSVPLSRHPLRLGHVHHGLFLPELEGSQGDRRRSLDPQILARHGPRARDRPEDSLRAPRAIGCVVVGRLAVDRRDARWAGKTSGPLYVPLPLSVQRLLRLRTRPHTAIRGGRRFPRTGRSPAALAAGSRLHRQADRGYRQRGDGRHAHSRDGRQGRARHHAAAFADVYREPAG